MDPVVQVHAVLVRRLCNAVARGMSGLYACTMLKRDAVLFIKCKIKESVQGRDAVGEYECAADDSRCNDFPSDCIEFPNWFNNMVSSRIIRANVLVQRPTTVMH